MADFDAAALARECLAGLVGCFTVHAENVGASGTVSLIVADVAAADLLTALAARAYAAGVAAERARCACEAEGFAARYPTDVWPEECPSGLTRFQAIEWAGAKMARRTSHNIAAALRDATRGT